MERMMIVKNKAAGKIGRKGMPFCRIIKTVVKNGREYQLHATKGWRSRRA
jgi:hypothetical protein